MKKSGIKTLDICYVALGTALITVCAWLAIPTPMDISFTMQTFAVFVVAGLLGWKRGIMSVAAYILLGACGVPVFSHFQGGFSVLAGATGGYIVGFLFTAFTVGIITKEQRCPIWKCILAMTAGLAICYSFGTVWFTALYNGSVNAAGLWSALGICVVPYLIPDAVKIALAAIVVSKVKPDMSKIREKSGKAR